MPLETFAKNIRTKMLSRKLPLEKSVKMIRNRKLPKTYREEVPLNIRTEMLLEKLSLETSSKKYREKWSLTTPVQKCGLNHYHLKHLSKNA